MKIRCLLALIAALAVLFAVSRPAMALVRHTVDDQELADVRAAAPQAAEAYMDAEARLREGKLLAAEQLLAKARELRPQSFLLARRHCQVLTELGRRAEAIAACTVALSGMTAMDERAYVGALMSGSALTTSKELADAVREAANARRLVGQPFSDAAFCEIAHHIGDDAMFTACLSGLEKSAPNYFETARFRAAHPSTPLWLYWFGWAVLAGLAALAFARAFWRWFKSPLPNSRKAGTIAALTLALSGLSASARAEGTTQPSVPHYQLSQFPINFEDPESQIPTIKERNANALEFGYFLQDLSAEALKAERASNFPKAVKFWRASAKAVPDEAVAFSHACRVYQIVQDRENALQYCARALNLHGSTTADYLRFSELMVAKSDALTDEEIKDLDSAITHLRAQPNGEGPAAVIECQLGVKLEDEKRLAHCTSVLAKTTPNDPHTLTFQWSLAMKRHNFSEARRLLDAMAKTSMAPAALADLRAATDKTAIWWRRPFVDPRYGFGLIALLGVGALLVIRKRSQLRGVPGNVAPAS